MYFVPALLCACVSLVMAATPDIWSPDPYGCVPVENRGTFEFTRHSTPTDWWEFQQHLYKLASGHQRLQVQLSLGLLPDYLRPRING